MKLELIENLGKGWQKINGTPVKVEDFSVAYVCNRRDGFVTTTGNCYFSPDKLRTAVQIFHSAIIPMRAFNGIIIGGELDGVQSFNFVKFTETEK